MPELRRSREVLTPGKGGRKVAARIGIFAETFEAPVMPLPPTAAVHSGIPPADRTSRPPVPLIAALVHGRGDTLSVLAGGVELLRHHYRAELHPHACPGPFAQPLRTLSGVAVTGPRPYDRRLGRATGPAAAQLSGAVSWGRGTQLPREAGRLERTGFTAVAAGGRTAITEDVEWTTADGRRWIAEERTWEVRDLDPEGGSWTLEFTAVLRNVLGEPVRFGGPGPLGRQLAGYCGLFWQGPRDVEGTVTVPGGAGQDAHGTRAPWLAFTADFAAASGPDAGSGAAPTAPAGPGPARGTPWEAGSPGSAGGTKGAAPPGRATLVFAARPDPSGAGSAWPDWLVRQGTHPAVNPVLALSGRAPLAPGEALRPSFRLVVAEGAWSGERIAAHLAAHPW
jgi:hypothetical protein